MWTSEGKRHVGRPRDPSIDHAVLEATLKQLREHGYAGFSIEAVAARAGTTKPTIARRWRRRQELIIAALARVLVRPQVPDTGCTRCDLVDGLEILADAVLRRMPPGVLAPLVADCAPDPQLHQYLTDALMKPTQEPLVCTVSQAIERGHLRPGVDAEQVVTVLSSVVFQSGMFADIQFDVKRAVEIVDLVLQGIAADFDHLVETSEREDTVAHRHPV